MEFAQDGIITYLCEVENFQIKHADAIFKMNPTSFCLTFVTLNNPFTLFYLHYLRQHEHFREIVNKINRLGCSDCGPVTPG